LGHSESHTSELLRIARFYFISQQREKSVTHGWLTQLVSHGGQEPEKVSFIPTVIILNSMVTT
jgi:hypothetical protein